MAKQRWVVRVVVADSQEQWFDNPLLECLRHAGVVYVHQNTLRTTFDVLLPLAVSSPANAEQLAEKMESHGFNAVAAPEWKP